MTRSISSFLWQIIQCFVFAVDTKLVDGVTTDSSTAALIDGSTGSCMTVSSAFTWKIYLEQEYYIAAIRIIGSGKVNTFVLF